MVNNVVMALAVDKLQRTTGLTDADVSAIIQRIKKILSPAD